MKLRNHSSLNGKAGKWEEYVIYLERLVKRNVWTADVAADTLLLSLSGNAAMYIAGVASGSSLMRSYTAGLKIDLELLICWQMINANCIIANNRKMKLMINWGQT